MITGMHTIVYAADADKARAFFRDVLKFPHVDAGRGWLIFALPPSEIAAHPADGDDESGRAQLYLMCDELARTVDDLKKRGVEFTSGVTDQRWGLLTTLKVPGAGEIGLYQPKHPLPPRAEAR